jgi:hypothetical protein
MVPMRIRARARRASYGPTPHGPATIRDDSLPRGIAVMPPTVSVVIPTYNRAHLVGRGSGLRLSSVAAVTRSS